MQGNLISGSLPPEIALANNLIKLDLSNNLLTGAIPEQVGQLTKLNLLSLQSNKLSSTIPHSLSLLKSLNVLNLSNNLLTGEIPECLCDLLPNSMAFSNNHLSGPIPLPLLRDGLRESFTGNPDLCIAGGNNNNSDNKSTYYIFPQCEHPSLVYHSKVWVVLSIMSALTFALIIFMVLVTKGRQCWWYGTRRGPKASHKSMSNSYNITSFHRARFDKNEIVRSLTDRNIIGEGGTGTVYRILLSNGYLVAVKKLASTKKLWYLERVLKSEVETLGNIRHKNIVKLYCFCSCPNSDSNFLVYEYVPNGNLWDALHGDARVFLDWPTRFKIALGIAQGLAYLHHHLLHPIVHRDIKSSNVLLDIDYQPKLSDFGIAKQLLNKTSTGDSTTLIVGTCGYLAPEYAYCSRPTTRCDVYSYAVVLMELLTGKKPLDPEFGENKDIVHWVSTKVRSNSSNSKEAAMEILDNRLSNGPCKNEMTHVVNIALSCSSTMPAFRPSMNQVVQLLLKLPT